MTTSSPPTTAPAPASAPMGRRRRWAIAVAAVLVIALVTAIVLVVRDAPGPRLSRAVDRTIEAGTARADITGSVLGLPLAGDVELTIARGELDLAGRRARLIRDLPALTGRSFFGGSEIGVVELVFADGGVWLRGPFDVEKPWFQLRDSQGQEAAASTAPGLGNPIGVLLLLRSLEGAPETVATEDVDGVETTRYRITVDLDTVGARAPQGARDFIERVQRLRGAGEPALPLDVWIDGDDHIRRVRYELSAPIGSITTVDLATDFVLSEFGEPVDIRIPTPQEVEVGPIERLGEFDPLGRLRDLLERLPF